MHACTHTTLCTLKLALPLQLQKEQKNKTNKQTEHSRQSVGFSIATLTILALLVQSNTESNFQFNRNGRNLLILQFGF